MTQQDDITQRLRDNADLDEAEHGNARVVQLERDAANEIERLRAELSKLRAPVVDERAALQKLVDLEDMRLRLKALHEMGHGTDYDYYHKALPAAWEAARAALASAPVAGETWAEQFIQAAIDRAPEPLRRLGEYLSRVLDEDQWPTAERMLLGACDAAPQAGECECARKSKAVANSEVQL